MAKGTTFQNDFLKLVFQGTTIANIAINATSSPITDLYVSLHTADPSGSAQNTNECAYTSYARVSVARSSGGWTITGNSVSPAATITFPTCTGGYEIATHMGIGTASSGAGKMLWSGTISPNIVIYDTIVPKIGTDTVLTED
jgi:hypothetical protein